MAEYRGEKTGQGYYKTYNRRVKNNKRWWEFWKPEFVIKPVQGNKQYMSYYYEKAYDKNGVGLLCGDTVKVVSKENNPDWSIGNEYKVKGIFQGDLMLGEQGFYCWPRNVIKSAPINPPIK